MGFPQKKQHPGHLLRYLYGTEHRNHQKLHKPRILYRIGPVHDQIDKFLPLRRFTKNGLAIDLFAGGGRNGETRKNGQNARLHVTYRASPPLQRHLPSAQFPTKSHTWKIEFYSLVLANGRHVQCLIFPYDLCLFCFREEYDDVGIDRESVLGQEKWG